MDVDTQPLRRIPADVAKVVLDPHERLRIVLKGARDVDFYQVVPIYQSVQYLPSIGDYIFSLQVFHSYLQAAQVGTRIRRGGQGGEGCVHVFEICQVCFQV